MPPINLCNVARFYRGQAHQTAALTWLQSQIPATTLEQFAAQWRAAPPDLVSLDDLLKITTVAPRSLLEKFVTPLNDGFKRFDVDTPLRVCHFLAQVLHESGELQYQEELASGADYEGRNDLGNTQPGDGRRYKGRGLIQVTGRFNYAQISRDLGVDYLTNPEKLANLPDCVHSAFWYWNSRGLSTLADQDNFEKITLIINGGFNGWDDRLKYLKRCKDVLL
jgi:putative chitinase